MSKKLLGSTNSGSLVGTEKRHSFAFLVRKMQGHYCIGRSHFLAEHQTNDVFIFVSLPR